MNLPAINPRLGKYPVQVMLSKADATKLERLRAASGDRSWGQTLRRLIQEASK